MPNVPTKVPVRIDEESGCDAANDGANVTPDDVPQAPTLRLSNADQARVADLLASPPEPNQVMQNAFAAHRAVIEVLL
ncbi:MAG: DUF1778 domain-containing protein [Ramlibacter sp.]